MALYVAVYDVHPGDRKHFERLLTRISDARKTESDILYIDAYGSLEALLKTPQKYDIIFLDCAEQSDQGYSNIEIAKALRENGISIPIAGYLGENMVPDTQCLLAAKSLGNLSFYTKPLLTPVLTEILSKAANIKNSQIPRIELRGRTDTYFALAEEIIMAKTNGFLTDIILSNGKTLTIMKDIFAFANDLSGHLHYIMINKETIINLGHVKKKSHFSLDMDNGIKVKIPVFEAKKVSQQYEKYSKLR